MSGHHPTSFQGDIFAAIQSSIEAAIPGAKVAVAGGGGHFEIQVISKSFEGQRTLQKHKAVLSAIAHLMQGDGAPVHAVDRIDARAE